MRYLEDFQAGDVLELGAHTFTRDGIVAFATQFDPQPFHVDEEAAGGSPFGGLVASGWHTCAVFMRLYVDAVLADSASLGSPGISDLRWLRPVRPGMTLHGRLIIEDVQPSERTRSRGTALLRCELRDADGEVVMTMRARGLFARRPDIG